MKLGYWVGLVACGVWAGRGLAAEVTYGVDPARSSLTISGTWGTLPVREVPQAYVGPPGYYPPIFGITAPYSGTIRAERDVARDTLRITGGAVAAQEDAAGYQFIPLDRFSGSPASYAVFSSSYVFDYSVPSRELYGAVRNFSFSLGSPLIEWATSGFDPSVISGVVGSGQMDYTVSRYDGVESVYTDGSSSLAGGMSFSPYPNVTLRSDDSFYSDSAVSSGGITYVIIPGTGVASGPDGSETLTIGVRARVTTVVEGDPLTLDFTGVLVATTPEPGAGAVLALCVPGLLVWRRRRRV